MHAVPGFGVQHTAPPLLEKQLAVVQAEQTVPCARTLCVMLLRFGVATSGLQLCQAAAAGAQAGSAVMMNSPFRAAGQELCPLRFRSPALAAIPAAAVVAPCHIQRKTEVKLFLLSRVRLVVKHFSEIEADFFYVLLLF